jgi:hypothetical protein
MSRRARRDLNAIFFADLASDPGRHAGGNHARGQVPCDHSPCADDGVSPDGHTGADDDPAAQPHVVGDRDRLPVLPAQPTGFRVDGWVAVRSCTRVAIWQAAPMVMGAMSSITASTLTNVRSPMLMAPYSQ